MKTFSLFAAAFSLVAVQTSAAAQDLYVDAVEADMASSQQGPAGVSASVGLRVPLGPDRAERENETTFGVTMQYGQIMRSQGNPLAQDSVRNVQIGEIQFDDSGPRSADLAGFNLTDFDRDEATGPRSNLSEGGWLEVGLAILIVPFVLVAVISDDDDE